MKHFVADIILCISQELARWAEKLDKLHSRLAGWNDNNDN